MDGIDGLIFKAVHFFLLTFSLESRTFSHQKRGVAQSGRAPALGAGGRGFKSLRPDQYEQGVVSFNSQPFIFWRYAYVTCKKMGMHKKVPVHKTAQALSFLVAPQGFEPRYLEPKSSVLPLDEGAI